MYFVDADDAKIENDDVYYHLDVATALVPNGGYSNLIEYDIKDNTLTGEIVEGKTMFEFKFNNYMHIDLASKMFLKAQVTTTATESGKTLAPTTVSVILTDITADATDPSIVRATLHSIVDEVTTKLSGVGATLSKRFKSTDIIETENWLTGFEIDPNNFHLTTIYDPENPDGIVDEVRVKYDKTVGNLIADLFNGDEKATTDAAKKTDAKEVGRLGFDNYAPTVEYYGMWKTKESPPEAVEFTDDAKFMTNTPATGQVKPAEDKLLLQVFENRLKSVEYRFINITAMAEEVIELDPDPDVIIAIMAKYPAYGTSISQLTSVLEETTEYVESLGASD